MAMMCEECKCSIYLEEQADGSKTYGGCENDCPCCNENIGALLEERTAQIIALTEEERGKLDDNDDLADSNPILHAEQGPNRFALMSLFFTDSDGVQIQEDLDLNEITVAYFAGDNDIPVTEGALYEWAINYYKLNY